MHYYKRNLGDYAKKAGRLSMLQHGSYTLLIDACYDREQFPTLDEAIEWTWASTTEEIEAVTFVLRKFFTLDGDVYVQKRIQEEIDEYHSKSETNKRIATEREAKRRENSTKRARSVNEAPPNHKPLTINQEPLTSKPTNPNGLVVIGDAEDLFEGIAKPEKHDCPHQQIIALYHEVLPMCPQVRDWTPARAVQLRARWNEEPRRQSLEYWKKFFEYVATCDFLVGKCHANGRKTFFADLEWIVKSANFTKIREGKYANE
jgi:uncharacterized protein YdaU (DUF1376 family)